MMMTMKKMRRRRMQGRVRMSRRRTLEEREGEVVVVLEGEEQ